MSTSFEAVDHQVRTGKAKRDRERIYNALRRNGPLTRNDLERHFQDNPPRIRINVVCPRVHELIEADRVEEKGTRVDPETGHPGKLLWPKDAEPVQGKLL